MNGKLTIVQGNQKGFSITLWPNRTAVLGRDKRCTLSLEDHKVSSRHCQITESKNQFLLADLSSRNGTYVNGEKIDKVGLKDKDTIAIGQSTLLFEIFESKLSSENCTEITQVWDEKQMEENLFAAESIGNYRILETFKTSPSFCTYKAEHNIHKNIVCVKALLWPRSLDNQEKEALQNRFDSLQPLQQVGIAAFYNCFWIEEKLVLVTEYIEGKSLASLLEGKKKVDLSPALKIGLNIAAALDYIHTKGFYHHSLSPTNVLIESHTRRIKLTDISLYPLLEKYKADFPEFLWPINHDANPQAQDIQGLARLLFLLLTSNPFIREEDLSAISFAPLQDFLEKVLLQKTFLSAKEFYKSLKKVLESVKNP